MSAIDISDALAWEDGLPRPQWDRIGALVMGCAPEARRDALLAATRQWLSALGKALGDGYETVESRHFLLLGPSAGGIARLLLRFAGRCRASILSLLPGIAQFRSPGKHVVVALRTRGEYYTYVSAGDPEGQHGGSAGRHIRTGYPHVVLWGQDLRRLESTLAHEFTHVALRHLSSPLWLEEGLAQMAQRAVAPPSSFDVKDLRVDEATAERQRRHWGEHGLDAFWVGLGFHAPGEMRRMSYQLAEILVRLLVEEFRPRWFGRDRLRRLVAFVHEARGADCGDAASRKYLGFGLGDLATTFLGPGTWSPTLWPHEELGQGIGPEASFEPDPRVAKAADVQSSYAIWVAAVNGLPLDWSESSVQQVERLLGRLHEDRDRAEPSPEEFRRVAQAFGCYVGEVLRRHHGGEWGTIRLHDRSCPGLRQAGGSLCCPWKKVLSRLTDGPEHDVWQYYGTLARRPT